MLGAYYPRRKSSTSSIPPNDQPPYSSALIESPTSTNRTFPSDVPPPLSHQRSGGSLPRVDEDSQQSSNDGLVARDYAPPPETVDSDHGTQRTQHTLSDSFIYTDHAPSTADPVGLGIQRPPALHRRPSPEKVRRADLLPPPSQHDAFVGQFITPMISATDERPAMVRSSSTPATSQPQGLQPSPLSVDTASTEGKALFDVMNASISRSAEEMVKVLKGHLEGVLKVQEEIGRLHLGLEKIGLGDHPSGPIHGTPKTPATPNMEQVTPQTGSRLSQAGSTPGSAKKEVEDAVLNREKGVDNIMERLDVLSTRLRTYHTLAQPQLSFPQSGNTPVSARGHASKPSLDPSSANIRRANSQKGVPPYSPLHPSPLRQGGGDSSTGGSSMLSGKRSQSHIGLASQGTPPERDIADRGVEHDDLYFKNFKMETTESPGRGHVARQHSRGDEAWFEHTRPRSGTEGSPRSMRDDFEANRSRPW